MVRLSYHDGTTDATMNNNANRTLIVTVCASMIVLMALLIFLTWRASADVIDNIGDLSEYLADHNDDAGKLIVTLSALIVIVLALLLIIVELAPEDEEKELRVKQAGATTIVPAAALRQRIEEALLAQPDITAAKAKVNTRDNGIATSLDLKLVPGANISQVTEDSTRVVNDTIQRDLGLAVAGVPTVRVAFGDPKTAPVASSVVQPPTEPQPEFAPAPTSDVQPYTSAAPAEAAVEEPPTPAEPVPAESPAPTPEPAPESPSEGADKPAPEAASEPAPEAVAGESASSEDGEDTPGSGHLPRDPWQEP